MAGQQVGHVPNTPNDFRISVSAGPVTLAPGEVKTMTVAIIIAPPVQGTYTPGVRVDPGSPATANRQITQIAAPLLDKARTLTAPQ
jgi:hypothetical protein